MSLRDLHKLSSSRIHYLSNSEEMDITHNNTQLFLDLYQSQLKHNEAYRKYCLKLTIPEPETISCIPAIPTDAFKNTNNPTSLKLSEIKTTFLTSGTTTETKGSHHFSTTSTYEASILAGWKYCKLPEFRQTLILTPDATEAPHSSLSHMMETLKSELATEARFVLREGQLDLPAILHCFQLNTPVTLLGTALAFLQLFEELPTPISLPEGSWALETGGYKGNDKSLTKEELYHLFQNHLGIAAENIWNEYSMTELSSQFYTRGLGNPHIAPPWTLIQVIDPETNLPAEPGQLGYLVIYDLANIDSVLAIRTQDLAIYHTKHSFTLIGRDPSALPRGCSRSL